MTTNFVLPFSRMPKVAFDSFLCLGRQNAFQLITRLLNCRIGLGAWIVTGLFAPISLYASFYSALATCLSLALGPSCTLDLIPQTDRFFLLIMSFFVVYKKVTRQSREAMHDGQSGIPLIFVTLYASKPYSDCSAVEFLQNMY